MPDDKEMPDLHRTPEPEDDLWAAAWPTAGPTGSRPPQRGVMPQTPPSSAVQPRPRAAAPRPVAERRIYRAEGDDTAHGRRGDSRPRREGPPPRTGGRTMKRTPLLAVVVLVVIAVVIALAGVAARDGGLSGSQSDAGSFKLLPLTTTSTS